MVYTLAEKVTQAQTDALYQIFLAQLITPILHYSEI